MRYGWWVVTALVSMSCAGESETCATGVELGEDDAGCDCGGDAFELFDNGATCVCEDDGLLCDTPPTSSSTSEGCRRAAGVDCG
jgi:hypothetical protein